MGSLLLLLSLPLTILALTASCAQTNITLGSSLPATAGAAWSSPSGRFALGFYPVEGGLAVGAWLATTPNITVTWTANRNATPSTGGSLSLNHDGQLVWSTDGQNVTIAETSQSATAAAMRDDGNFVLYGTDATTIMWSTFGAPTDTLCAGQDLLPGQQLFSSVSDTNKATGKYRLDNQDDANLVLYPVQTTNVANSAYWASNTDRIGFLLTLRLDANGVLYLVGKNGSYTKNLTQPKAAAQVGSHDYYRATLDPDGILRVYGHALSANGGWKTDVEWVALSDRCSVKGVCGTNSYCVLDRDARPTCACPPGFAFVNTSNRGLGCEANASVGDCSAGGVDAASSAVMAGLANVSWTDTPYMLLPRGMSAADCGAACLSDCFCTAVLHDSNDGGTCTKQQLPLLYGHAGGPYTLFVKTRATAATPARRRKDGRGVGRAATIALVCMALLTCLSLSAFLVFARLLWVNLKAVQHDVMSLSLANANAADALDEEAPLRSYTYRELEEATHGFRDPIGRGAFGTVFKGSLNGGEKAIAVKRLEKLVEDGEREFQREVRAIGRTNHRNLVRLLGFCHEGANRLLVYEFMSNGSLADLLFRSTSHPAWPDRVRIALDVARGLHYLHDELDSRVIHCDVKPQNILMNAAGKAKIADFGLAKLLLPDQTRTFTGVRGTRGYLAPEWYRGTGPVTVKADVYSYGVVLLETVTCRRSMEMEEAGEDCTLMEWVYGCLVRRELRRSTMTDISDEEAAVEEMLERVVKVGIWCVQEEPQSRPSMKSVILMLEGNMEVSFPPPPPSSL